MTVSLTDYTSLITSEHNQKPKYLAMVSLLAGTLVDIQNTTLGITGGYDLDVAVGDALDTLGRWIGLSRQVVTPITGVYFAWDTDGVGWDQGNWRGPFDPLTGLTTLDDDTYRLFLKATIGANHWDGTIEHWQSVMNYVFTGTGTVISFVDYQDMSMDVVITGVPPSALVKALIRDGYFILKPGAVRINGYFITSVPGTPIFAWDAPGSSSFAGWDTGSWAATL